MQKGTKTHQCTLAGPSAAGPIENLMRAAYGHSDQPWNGAELLYVVQVRIRLAPRRNQLVPRPAASKRCTGFDGPGRKHRLRCRRSG